VKPGERSFHPPDHGRNEYAAFEAHMNGGHGLQAHRILSHQAASRQVAKREAVRRIVDQELQRPPGSRNPFVPAPLLPIHAFGKRRGVCRSGPDELFRA
jgi:hypothetical protein